MNDDHDSLPPFEDGAQKIGTIQPRTRVVGTDDMDPEERAVLMAQEVCGQCKYFEYAAGQQEILRTKFLDALTSRGEIGWKLHHLGAPANDLGFCGAYTGGSGGEARTITAKLNRGCDQFRQNNGLVTLRRKSDG